MTRESGSQGKATRLLLALLPLVCLTACGQAATVPGQSEVVTGREESIMTSGQDVYVGSDNGRLYAFSATSGAIQWLRVLGGQVTVYAVAGGTVYVSTAANGGANTSGAVFALSAATGQVLWLFHRPGSDGFILMVNGGIVYADGGKTIFAISATDGKELWQYPNPTELGGLLGTGNGVVYVSHWPEQPDGAPSTLSALDAGAGRVLWTVTLPGSDGVAAGPPAESNGMVYVETGYGDLYALDAGTGKVRWRASTVASGTSPPSSSMYPVVAGGLVYIGGPLGLAAFGAADGVVAWYYRTFFQSGFLPQPVLVSGVIYSGGNGFIVALNAADGTLIWRRLNMNGPTFGAMMVNDGAIIYNGNAGPVYALKSSEGSLLWQSSYTPEDGWQSAPAGAPEALDADAGSSGVIYISTDTGVIHALRVSDGSQLWQYAIPALPLATPSSVPRY